MTTEEMINMRAKGATFKEIANIAGVSKQCVQQNISAYMERRSYLIDRPTQLRVNGMRGSKLCIEDIVYTGIYEYFRDNPDESLTSFTCRVYGNDNTHTNIERMRRLIKGGCDSAMPISIYKKICRIVGKPFEEVFEERDIEEKGE